ncbi:MAG TPA: phosphoglycerate kinase [Bryobacteraceae bacterium]|nr:phosphoglycerate kinase [Bryobacteraceae bacterium]
MPKLSIRNLDLRGKRIFMRVDFNVPLAPGGKEITSDKRIRASLPTIKYALEQGAQLVLASHLGRPKGKPNPEMSLKPVAARLQELLGQPVVMAPDCIEPEVDQLKAGNHPVVLLENLRFHPEEEKNDAEFARALAAGCDYYVNDAFGTAHRAHASTVGITKHVAKSAAGLLMEKELDYLGRVTNNPPRPCIGILGGAKVSDKIEVIENLLKFVDQLMIGGAMAYTFLRAQGRPTGKSLVEEDKIDLAKSLLEKSSKLKLPVDHVVTAELKEGAPYEEVETIPETMIGVDIGPKTREIYAAAIATAKSIIWNGPMGVFEKPPFDRGTVAIAKAVADSGALSVVGGGDSEKAVKAAGVADKISHISTGGGASLEYLSGIELPGVAALSDN